MQLTKNFTLDEFNCHDGTVVPPSLRQNVRVLANSLQALREHLKEPIHVNSGYRTVTYNQSVGGKPNSMHLQAKAADITVKSKRPRQLAAIIEHLIAKGEMKQGGLGVYPGFVHYDVRGIKARW